MIEFVSISISAVALTLSVVTAWLTILQRGRLRATRPTVVYFGPDAGGDCPPKVFLRTLLYSTGQRGKVIEHMYARVSRRDNGQVFSIWVYGERDQLVRGSGLHVGPNGHGCNHHFLMGERDSTFRFTPGDYTVELFATCVGDRKPRQLLHSGPLHVDVNLAKALDEGKSLYFDWSSDSGNYAPHVEEKRPLALPPPAALMNLLMGDGPPPSLRDRHTAGPPGRDPDDAPRSSTPLDRAESARNEPAK